MNDFQLQVRGYGNHENVECVRPVFVWKTSAECRQFTIEMSRSEKI